jgi:hypothetical protein
VGDQVGGVGVPHRLSGIGIARPRVGGIEAATEVVQIAAGGDARADDEESILLRPLSSPT